MGEYAEMMLDGIVCQGCGEYMGDGRGEGCGFPTYCTSCRRELREDTAPRPIHGKPVGCPNCKRRFKTHDAYLDHYRAKHDASKAP